MARRRGCGRATRPAGARRSRMQAGGAGQKTALRIFWSTLLKKPVDPAA